MGSWFLAQCSVIEGSRLPVRCGSLSALPGHESTASARSPST